MAEMQKVWSGAMAKMNAATEAQIGLYRYIRLPL
jgi:hypothetical protein